MNYFEMYRDVWNYHKKYIDGICDDDEYWQNVGDESNAISKKYGECKFIINLLLAEITEFERLYKEMKANANAGV